MLGASFDWSFCSDLASPYASPQKLTGAQRFWAPEDEQLQPAQVKQKVVIGEPTASIGLAPCFDLDDLPEPHRWGEALLPLSQELTTPKRSRDEEPTALGSPQCVGPLLQPAPKLRRLSGKTTVPAVMCPEREHRVLDLSKEKFEPTAEEFLTLHFFRRLDGAQQYNWVYDRLRAFYVKHVHPRTLTLDKFRAHNSLTGAQRQKEGRSAFKELTSAEKATVARSWLLASTPPKHIANFVDARFITEKTGFVGTIKTKGVLLTWMFPRSSADVSSVVDDEEPTALRELVRRLRLLASVQTLWKEFQQHAQSCLRLSGGQDVAVCLEVCPDTWETKGGVQLHGHAFLKASTGELRAKNLSTFEFQATKPHLSQTVGGVLCSSTSRTSWAGFFYCCILEKSGTLFSEASKLPFKGFLVQPNWILNLVQSRKLEIDIARTLLVQCVNASRHVKELEAHERHLEEEAVQKAQAEAYRLLGATLKQQKTYEEADAFVKQFAAPAHRYKFLVLSGPSRVGKTAFARSLCTSGFETLEVNCASGAEPDLRAYRLSKHDLILFDEIQAQQVADQRKLFQAQSAPVQLGCSATNCHSYEVFVWRKKMVLASNNWFSSLAAASDADRAWIVANSIVLVIDQPMWIE